MRLSVPCNWDPELLERLSGISDICETTAAMKVTPVGGGRPAVITKAVESRGAEDIVKAAHENGWRFSYLLNAPCMGNMEYDVTTHRAVLDHLSWLGDIGVDIITVTIPYLIELIKKQFPGFYVRASVITGIDTVPRAGYFVDIGADAITVDYMKNRDFAFLAALRAQIPCDFSLLVNDQCLYQCPYRGYHYNACGHASQSWDPQQNYFFDYSMVRCMVDKLRRPERLVMMPFIRPEDMAEYEAMGFDTFKISGRHMETDAIVRAVTAYASRRFDGNLMEILNPFAAPGDTRIPALHNRALDGFLEPIKAIDCENQCGQCDHCRGVAKRAVTVDADAVDAHLKTLVRHIDGLASSGFLPKKAGRAAAR